MTGEIKQRYRQLKWKSCGGTLTKGAYKGDAGIDLVCTQNTIVRYGKITQIVCGVKIALPLGLAALIMGRSSSNAKGLFIFPSLIEQYRGDIFVTATSIVDSEVFIDKGHRVAQLVPILDLVQRMTLKETHEELPKSERGTRGFGSSGR